MMKKFPLCRRAFLPVAFLLSIAGSAAAQTRVIRTTTGKEYVCRVLSADSEKLMVRMEGRRALRYFGRDSIRSIRSLPREEKEGRYDMLTLALEGGYSYRGRIFASTGDCSLNGVQCAGEGMPWHDMTDGFIVGGTVSGFVSESWGVGVTANYRGLQEWDFRSFYIGPAVTYRLFDGRYRNAWMFDLGAGYLRSSMDFGNGETWRTASFAGQAGAAYLWRLTGGVGLQLRVSLLASAAKRFDAEQNVSGGQAGERRVRMSPAMALHSVNLTVGLVFGR